jgi:hypothetical protein
MALSICCINFIILIFKFILLKSNFWTFWIINKILYLSKERRLFFLFIINFNLIQIKLILYDQVY